MEITRLPHEFIADGRHERGAGVVHKSTHHAGLIPSS